MSEMQEAPPPPKQNEQHLDYMMKNLNVKLPSEPVEIEGIEISAKSHDGAEKVKKTHTKSVASTSSKTSKNHSESSNRRKSSTTSLPGKTESIKSTSSNRHVGEEHKTSKFEESCTKSNISRTSSRRSSAHSSHNSTIPAQSEVSSRKSSASTVKSSKSSHYMPETIVRRTVKPTNSHKSEQKVDTSHKNGTSSRTNSISSSVGTGKSAFTEATAKNGKEKRTSESGSVASASSKTRSGRTGSLKEAPERLSEKMCLSVHSSPCVDILDKNNKSDGNSGDRSNSLTSTNLSRNLSIVSRSSSIMSNIEKEVDIPHYCPPRWNMANWKEIPKDQLESEEFLHCCNCNEGFDANNKQPLRLFCHHNMCESCVLGQLKSTFWEITCGKCPNKTILPAAYRLQYLRINTELLGVLGLN